MLNVSGHLLKEAILNEVKGLAPLAVGYFTAYTVNSLFHAIFGCRRGSFGSTAIWTVSLIAGTAAGIHACSYFTFYKFTFDTAKNVLYFTVPIAIIQTVVYRLMGNPSNAGYGTTGPILGLFSRHIVVLLPLFSALSGSYDSLPASRRPTIEIDEY
ncbi:MAG: hypothetical protein Tsb0021_02410 [Chlamydiales bacterium]